jgi:hypothetical protein
MMRRQQGFCAEWSAQPDTNYRRDFILTPYVQADNVPRSVVY